mgnify:CR=1 FL=1
MAAAAATDSHTRAGERFYLAAAAAAAAAANWRRERAARMVTLFLLTCSPARPAAGSVSPAASGAGQPLQPLRSASQPASKPALGRLT